MKKFVSIVSLFIFTFFFTLSPAHAAPKNVPKYSLPTKGLTVLQAAPNRNIQPQTEAIRHALIPGESPTTGLPWTDHYLPMLVQISNVSDSVKVKGRTVKAAGLGKGAPWGVHHADIAYETLLMPTGWTRFSFLFNDSFASENPQKGVGAVRSLRLMHAILREEWQSGLVFGNASRYDNLRLNELFQQSPVNPKDILFSTATSSSSSISNFCNRVQGVRAPDNMNVNVPGMRTLIPSAYAATPRPFLFSDTLPSDTYAAAETIHLDWGSKECISHFQYDKAQNLYLRYCGAGVKPAQWAPFLSFAGADDRSPDNQVQLSFSNVIVQRVEYTFPLHALLPEIEAVGQGNAELFIGGRYIPGYWVCNGIGSPTVFYDDQGHEVKLQRGKTFIAQFPTEALCAFTE